MVCKVKVRVPVFSILPVAPLLVIPAALPVSKVVVIGLLLARIKLPVPLIILVPAINVPFNANAPLLVKVAPNVKAPPELTVIVLVCVTAAVSVTGEPDAIVTGSLAAGTVAGVHVAATFQFPPAPVEVCATCAKTELESNVTIPKQVSNFFSKFCGKETVPLTSVVFFIRLNNLNLY